MHTHLPYNLTHSLFSFPFTLSTTFFYPSPSQQLFFIFQPLNSFLYHSPSRLPSFASHLLSHTFFISLPFLFSYFTPSHILILLVYQFPIFTTTYMCVCICICVCMCMCVCVCVCVHVCVCFLITMKYKRS